MDKDYEPRRPNSFVDIPAVTDATVQAMLADLQPGGPDPGAVTWPNAPPKRLALRVQIRRQFWRAFGRPVWVRQM